MKNKKSLTINYKGILIFLIVLFRYLKMQKVLSNSKSNLIFLGIILLVLIIIIRRRILRNINFKWLIFSLILAFAQLLFLQDVDILLLIAISIIFSEDKDAIKKIIKYFLISLIIIFISTILLSKLGILNYSTISRVIEGNIRVQRNSLGFKHPNEAYVYFFFISIGMYYFSRKKLSYCIVMLIGTFIMYNITLSRTGLICSIAFLLLILFYNKNIKINKYMFIIATVITFLIAVIFGDPNNTINIMLSNRPFLYNYYITNGYIFNLIGNKIVDGITLDNSFLNLIVGSGLLFYGFYSILYYLSGKLLENDRKLTQIFIIILIYGCIETHALNIGLNFVLIIQMYLLLTKNNKLKELNENEEN